MKAAQLQAKWKPQEIPDPKGLCLQPLWGQRDQGQSQISTKGKGTKQTNETFLKISYLINFHDIKVLSHHEKSQSFQLMQFLGMPFVLSAGPSQNG